MWHNILERLNATSKSLQKIDVSLDQVVELYNSLVEYVKKVRISFDEHEQDAKTLTNNHAYVADKQRKRKRKAFFDEDVDGSDDEQFSGR